MSNFFDCTLRAGYYSLGGGPYAEHTFVTATRDGDAAQFAFPCFGSFGYANGERGHQAVVYPAEFWSPYAIGSRPQGKELRGNLYVALGMARWSTQPGYDYQERDWDNFWSTLPEQLRGYSPSCNAGLLYAVTGVCHQATNRILWASRQGDFTTTPVNWPPSFSKSYWVYGYYGKLSEEAAIAFANNLINVVRASGVGARKSGKTDSDELKAIAKVAEQATVRSIAQSKAALTTNAAQSAADRGQEIEAMLALTKSVQISGRVKGPQGIIEIDREFQALKKELDIQLIRGEVSHKEYADKVNAAFCRMMEELRNEMAPEVFKVYFGDGKDTLLIVAEEMPDYKPYQQVMKL